MHALNSAPPLIQFKSITLEALDTKLSTDIDSTRLTITSISTNKNTSWQDLLNRFYPKLYQLQQTWGLITHFHSVNDCVKIRNLHNKFEPLITELFVGISQNQQLFTIFTNIKKQEYNNLDHEAQKVIDNELRDFFLGGVSLKHNQKNRFSNIVKKLSKLSTKFEQNVLDATDRYVKLVNKMDLGGLPDDLLAQYLIPQSQQDGLNYKITLQLPSYLPIMQYCANRKLRKELYFNYVTRASSYGPRKFDNSKIINQILESRLKKAKILGFDNYSSLSLYNKMAENSSEILKFLYQLAEKSRKLASNEFAELQQFAKTTEKITKLEAWDIAYFAEKLQIQKYNYSNNELKQYFPVAKVLNGLFSLIKQLYNIELQVVDNSEIWHNDVLTYKVIDNTQTIGYLYFDLYARTGKQSGAWMNPIKERYFDQNNAHLPTALVICNFTPPRATTPSLLTFDDVQTLFHEIGHALHSLLTTVNHYTLAGTNNVEWDAIELPSQFMENFVWNYDILKTLSEHHQTKEQISKELYDKLLSARHFQTALQMLRQLEFAIFDIKLHSINWSKADDYLELLNQVRNEIAIIIPPEYNRFPNSFSHIFAGGYAAGYYSYKWAEVLALDVFSQFDNIAADKLKNLGQKFRKTILARGGTRPMLDNFIEFMGRAPQIDALLKYSGIVQ